MKVKKIISIITAALLALPICVPAYAAESVSQVPGNTDISVCAKYVDKTGFTVIPTDEAGNGSVTLPDGTEITISDADTAKGRIVVEEVTDQEAIDWIAEQLGDKVIGVRMYHVYRLDGNGVSCPTDDVTVTAKPKDASADSVYAVSDARTDKLQSVSENGEITFAANGTYFYALCRDSGNASSQQDNFPVWIVPLAVACGATPFIVVFIRKRKR